MTRSHSAVVRSRNGAPPPTPALTIAMSRPPNSRDRLAHAFDHRGFVADVDDAAPCRRRVLREVEHRDRAAPSTRNRATHAAPMPLAPPVTIARAPASSIEQDASVTSWRSVVRALSPAAAHAFDGILERTLAAEAAGFDSVWLMDHSRRRWRPKSTRSKAGRWRPRSPRARRRFASATSCSATRSAIRHCSPRWRRASTSSRTAASSSGIGWGSVPRELDIYGFGTEPPAVRAAKLRETLDILELMFAGEAFDYHGAHFTFAAQPDGPCRYSRRSRCTSVAAARQLTMPLVARLRRLVELPRLHARPHRRAARRSRARRASRRSTRSGSRQLLPSATTIAATVERRFGSWGGVLAGTADEVATRNSPPRSNAASTASSCHSPTSALPTRSTTS